MSKKKIILHIGMHKTGTTALQGFFANYSEEFSQQKIIYPTSARRANQHFFLTFSPSSDLPVFSDSWKDLYHEMKQTSWNTMVLSSERFVFRSEFQIKELMSLCDWFCADVHVVIFLRNHINMIKSLYRTAIKSLPRVCCTADLYTDFYINENSSLRRGETNNALDYNQIIENWAKVFTKEKIHILHYDEIIKKSNTIEAFLNVMKLLGIETPVFKKEQLAFRTHQTQPDIILDLLLRTNQLFFNKIPYWQFIRHLFKKGADSNLTTRDLQFSKKSIKKVLSVYGELGDEKKHLKKILKTDKSILSEKQRLDKQLELLQSMDQKWQTALTEICPFDKIVNIPVINNERDHYKILYERDSKALRQFIDREAQIQNSMKSHDVHPRDFRATP